MLILNESNDTITISKEQYIKFIQQSINDCEKIIDLINAMQIMYNNLSMINVIYKIKAKLDDDVNKLSELKKKEQQEKIKTLAFYLGQLNKINILMKLGINVH